MVRLAFIPVALLLSLTARPAVGCELVWGLLERLTELRLARTLQGEDRIMNYPAVVTRAQLSRSEAAAIDALLRFGTRFRALTAPERRALGLECGIAEAAQHGTQGPRNATFFELLSVRPITGAAATPETSALGHPLTPALLARLQRLGVRVYVDPSLPLVGVDGMFHPRQNVITLNAAATYSTLLHEATHAEFHHWQLPRLIADIGTALARGENVQPLLQGSRHAGFGEARLQRVVELVRAGYPEHAIDERLAVDAQVDLYRAAGYDVRSAPVISANGYARDHVINELTTLAVRRPLAPVERLTLLRSLVELFESPESGNAGPREFSLSRRYARLLAARNAEAAALAGRLETPQLQALRHSAMRWERRQTLVRLLQASGIATVVGVAFNQQLGELVVFLSDGSILRWVLGPGDGPVVGPTPLPRQ